MNCWCCVCEVSVSTYFCLIDFAYASKLVYMVSLPVGILVVEANDKPLPNSRNSSGEKVILLRL